MKRLIAATVLTFVFAHSVEAEDSARDEANKMLDAMGGAAAWADIRTVHNTAVNHHPDARLPYIQEYWYDTQIPRHYIKLNNFDVDRKRAYSSAGGWSLTEGALKPFSDERLNRELDSWARSLYRKFYLLAKDPDSLDLATGPGGRIEFSHQGNFIGWMIVNDAGEPTRHGSTPSTEDYTNFGPLAQFGPIAWPASGNDDAGWDFEILSVHVSTEVMPMSVEPPQID